MAGNTPTFNLKAVILETGLTPATLRAWERRYDFLRPQRSAGGHRLYSQDEIDMLRWLVARQAEGLSISHAVELWHAHATATEQPSEASTSRRLASQLDPDAFLELRRHWVAACLSFNEPAAELALGQALAQAAPEVVCTEILLKGLAEIGSGWYEGKVSVQQEHFASALALRRLNALVAAAPRPIRTERLLAACPPGETHDLVLLTLTFILRWRGWDVVYLGANVPLERLDATVRSTSPKLVIAVAQTLAGAAAMRKMAELLADQGTPLSFGGGIFNQIPGLVGRIPGYFLGRDLQSVPQTVERLLQRAPVQPLPMPIPPAYLAALEGFNRYESQIAAFVKTTLQDGPIAAHHIEEANTHLSRAIASGLALGEMNLLNHSINWLIGLLAHHNLAVNLAEIYFSAYRQAVEQHLGTQARPVLDWFADIDLSKPELTPSLPIAT
jgi:DNA-binding transcriptional MerR regulator